MQGRKEEEDVSERQEKKEVNTRTPGHKDAKQETVWGKWKIEF